MARPPKGRPALSNLNQHLLRRGAIYHYRRRLPAPLKEILNRTHFDGSLETADPARARRLARQISVAMDQLAERLQAMPPSRQPTPGQLNLAIGRASGRERVCKYV